MPAQEFAVVLLLTAYLAPPAFIIHILWLLVGAVLSGKHALQDVETIEEDFLLPHPPGFFDPLQVDLARERSPENSGFDGSPCIPSADGLALHDFDSTYALENESSGYEIQDVTTDTLDLASLDTTQLQDNSEPRDTKGHLDSTERLTIVASVDDTRSFVRRSTHKKIKHFFRKSSSPETHRNSTAFSRRVTQIFNKISVPWNRRKERQKRQDMSSI